MSLWLIHVNVRQKPTQYCKVIILQLKKKIKEKECYFNKEGKYQIKNLTLHFREQEKMRRNKAQN